MANKKIFSNIERIMYEEDIFNDETDVFYTDDVQEDEFIDEPIYEIPKLQRTRAYRRKQKVRHKHKLRFTAIDAMNNCRKRDDEDMKNISFCRRRGGQSVKLPKSLTARAEKVWARAAKMKLV